MGQYFSLVKGSMLLFLCARRAIGLQTVQPPRTGHSMPAISTICCHDIKGKGIFSSLRSPEHHLWHKLFMPLKQLAVSNSLIRELCNSHPTRAKGHCFLHVLSISPPKGLFILYTGSMLLGSATESEKGPLAQGTGTNPCFIKDLYSLKQQMENLDLKSHLKRWWEKEMLQ